MHPAPTPPDQATPRARRPRGERLWHSSVEPIFLISRHRRLIYANPAWERLTGLAFTDARGRACRRRSAASAVEPVEQVLSALAPPLDALDGKPSQLRRRAPGKPQTWWDIDFFPWSSAEGVQGILGRIRTVQESGPAHGTLPEKLVQIRSRTNQIFRIDALPADLPIVQRLIAQMRMASQTRLPALILGPSGSGKEWTARTIHHMSAERESHFATFDARLPAAALTDLFAASKHWRIGAVYFKHIERLPRDAQAMLIDRLATEAGEPGPRLFAGATANLEGEAHAGTMLPELHVRLSAMTIQVPALPQRLEDLPRLVRDMLPRASDAAAHVVRTVSAAAMEILRRHAWPGNLRELYEVLVQGCGRAKTEQLEADDLPFYLQARIVLPDKPLALDDTLAKVERRLIELAIRIAQGNKTNAAELLGIWRARLIRRLEQLNMESKPDASP